MKCAYLNIGLGRGDLDGLDEVVELPSLRDHDVGDVIADALK